MPDQAHFLSSSSFIEFQAVEFEHESRLNFARVFRVLTQVTRVFQAFFELEFSQVRVFRVKTRRLFDLRVAPSGTNVQIYVSTIVDWIDVKAYKRERK